MTRQVATTAGVLSFPLVGMMGRARAGKDTVAARLVERHRFKRFAFADALREAALIANPIVTPVDTVAGSVRLADVVAGAGWEAAKEHREVRRTLQQFGIGIRHLQPDFWVRVVMDEVDHYPGPVVITDVRFPNEAAAIKAAGGSLVRVIRPGQDESDQHISETALSDYSADFELLNDSDLHSLLNKVDALASML
ncbi:deoxynucleotide monophosphate kinase family protein [Micromonospora sediminicola]|uniref:deoxynucleotide monophosphate kinase family protein n=1 Tax=Micromonospora sediminicola TaxID=946078 RepID=UPI0037A8C45D